MMQHGLVVRHVVRRDGRTLAEAMLVLVAPLQGVKKANFHRVRIHVGMAREKAKDLDGGHRQ